MISAYTDACTDPLAADLKWKTPKPGDFDEFGKYFTPKDVAVMEAIFREFHEVTDEELKAITGKALPVSEG